jgi:transposase
MSYYLFQKKRARKIYWYIGKSERTNKGVRRIYQKYLGTAEKIEEIFNKDPKHSIYSRPFGSIAAMLCIAEELNLKEIISKIVPDKNYKLSIYQHIIMQGICRFNKPLSKNASIKWFKDSILPLLWKKDFQSPQTIFNQFDKIANQFENKIPKIEEELCKVLLQKGIKPSTLIWDPTNFFTYIEKGEELAKKGASKEKRFDKNLINLGLVVSEDNIPLMHLVYEGNKRESDVITDITKLIHERLKKLDFEIENIVFVFDKGNNSKYNIPKIKKKFHFVGSLRMNQMSHLLGVPLSEFKELYTNKKEHLIKGFKTKSKIYGEEYTVVVTYNEESAKKQKETTEKAVQNISEKMKAIEDSFKNKKNGKKTTVKGLSGRINDFLHRQYRILFDWKFDEEKQQFSWSLNKNALEERKKAYGKNILFTDLSEWKTEDIAKTYNSKAIVESDFKVFKDKLLIPVKPFYSRKDPRLKVHIFICVLSMILYRYMQWKLKDLNHSENRLNDELRSMKLAFLKQEGSNSVKKVLENMSPEQMEIYSKLNLGKFMPN